MNELNAALYTLLTKHTGKVSIYPAYSALSLFSLCVLQNITNVLDVELLYNTLKIETDAGLTLPDWTENIYPDRLVPMAERSYKLLTETNLMKRVKGGAFLTEILNNMLNKRKRNLQPDRKIFLYAGHDVTMVNVLHSMNLLEDTARLPEYASALVFELHHSSLFKDDFEVKVWRD